MVGLTISLIVTVAAMLVFKNVATTALASRQSSSADSLFLSSSISAGMLLHDAGYGITDPELGTHLVVVTGATLTSNRLSGTLATGATHEGNAVIWEFQPGTVRQCAGLYFTADDGLQHLPAVNCSGASAWSTLTWAPVMIAPPPSTPDIFTMIAINQGCKPFGVTTGSGNVVVSLSTTRNKDIDPEIESENETKLGVDHCLINFPAP